MTRLRYASEWGLSGYATAARRLLHALALTGIDLVWQALDDAGPLGRMPSPWAPGAPAGLRARRSPPRAGDALVLHCPPMSWHAIAQELRPGHVIGHTVWETERVPERWRREMDGVDEFWVPTAWNQRAFAEAFDRPVHVVPHVIATVPPEPPPLELPEDRRVVAIVSAWDWRKRPDRTLEAALRAFQGRDDVTIVVKTGSWLVAWPDLTHDPPAQIARIRARVPRAPEVVVDVGGWSDGEVLGLLERAQCVLSLTASEGWGLGPFEAACLGTPVVMTGYGGQVEWLGADHPGLVPFRMVPAEHPDTSLFEPGMRWAEADMDAAIDLVRAVVDDAAPVVRAHTTALRASLLERFDPAAVASILIDVLPDAVVDTAIARLAPADPAPVPSAGSLLVLTPAKNAARHADGWADRVLSLRGSCDRLEAAVLVSDSDDGTLDAFRAAARRLEDAGVPCLVVERDFGLRLPDDQPRWAPHLQLDRRRVLAKSRNHLLFAALREHHDWVLWLDADVVSFPDDVVTTMLATGADLVQPNCTQEPGGPSFDMNAWTDRGWYHLDDYRGLGPVELHAVGGTMLLVRADGHRDGLVWPAFPYGVVDPRARDHPDQIGRDELGEIESEGLGLLAGALGYECVGLPDVEILHE